MENLPNSFELVINPVSFGQVSLGILREIHSRGVTPISLFITKGNFNLDSFDENQDFVDWLKLSTESAISKHDKDIPTFKLWHLNGSQKSYSSEQVLFTFHELDQVTKEESAILKRQKSVLTCSSHSKDVFEAFGNTNVSFCPLAFDQKYFFRTNKTYLDDRITFGVVGKFEKRKNHVNLIRAWLKKYGNDPKFYLNCAIYNTFAKPEENQSIWAQITEGKQFSNVRFHPFMGKNVLYNDFLNSNDIILGMSGGEAWGLPEFNSVGLGKHSVILNAPGYREWANDDNSVMVEPNGKTEVYDGQFFRKGEIYNQGSIFTFGEESFLDGCEKAVARFRENPLNENGEKLKTQFSYKKMVDIILKSLN
jgi:glycosyltransferase involved in cell wall biosynthesis